MKQAMREHFRLCGRVEAFLSTYAALSSEEKEPGADAELWFKPHQVFLDIYEDIYETECLQQNPVREDAFWAAAYRGYSTRSQDSWRGLLWFYCYFCPVKKAAIVGPSPSSIPCPDQCELGALFVAGWQEGQEQARQAFETGDLAIFEDIGRAAGKTSRRPPRNTRSHTAERDGVDGNLHGEALRRFVQCWRQTGRRYEGV